MIDYNFLLFHNNRVKKISYDVKFDNRPGNEDSLTIKII